MSVTKSQSDTDTLLTLSYYKYFCSQVLTGQAVSSYQECCDDNLNQFQ